MLSLFLYIPPDFYPAYRRVKAGENGWGLAYTGLYAPIHAYTRGNNQVGIEWKVYEIDFFFNLPSFTPPVRATVGEVRYSIEIDVGGE